MEFEFYEMIPRSNTLNANSDERPDILSPFLISYT